LVIPSNDIDLKQVCISSDLLVDTELKLFDGVHYVPVWSNGNGKLTHLCEMYWHKYYLDCHRM